MRISKAFLSLISCILILSLLCSCNLSDFGFSEGQIEDIISQIEDKTKDFSSETDNKSANGTKDESNASSSSRNQITNNKPSGNKQNNGYVSSASQGSYTNDEHIDTGKPISKPQQNGNICRITSLKDLQEFANTVRCGHSYQGEQVTLEADIDLAGIEWIPIGSRKKPFKGTFSGKGHTISNLTITSITDQMSDNYGANASIGFFGYAEDAVITSLNLKNVNINLSNQTDMTYINVGSVVGYMMAINNGIKLTKCTASGVINVSVPQDKIIHIGGIAGGFDANYRNTFYNMYLLQSNVNITAVGYHSNIGGIAGIINSCKSDSSDSFISDMIYIGNINEEKVRRSNAGGICGLFSSAYRCDVNNCFVKLTLNRVGFNSYTELKPNLGILIGDQCVGTAELGLNNIYGCVVLNGVFEEMPLVGRAHSEIYYNNCLETDQVPESADSNIPNWNLADRTSPTINIEKH